MCVCVLWASNVHGVLAVKCMDDFGLRLIFTLSARLQFTLCSSIINLSYVILLFFVWLLLRFPTVCRFVSHSVVFIFFYASHSLVMLKGVAYFSRRQDESHLSDLCFPFIIFFALVLPHSILFLYFAFVCTLHHF